MLTRWTDLKLLPRRLSSVTTPRSWDELSALLLSENNLHLFRGQASSDWDLQTRLHRTFPTATLAHEKRMLQVFRADAPTYLEAALGLDEGVIQWLGLMQHYGAPTRMLDWTQSPFVALFFAVESGNDDGAVWLLDKSWGLAGSISRLARDKPEYKQWGGSVSEVAKAVLEKHTPSMLPISTRPRFPRMTAQEGSFTLVGGVDADVLQNLEHLADSPSSRRTGEPFLRKVVIRSDLKPQCREFLAAMRITHATIYPDLEGLARSLPYREYIDWYDA